MLRSARNRDRTRVGSCRRTPSLSARERMVEARRRSSRVCEIWKYGSVQLSLASLLTPNMRGHSRRMALARARGSTVMEVWVCVSAGDWENPTPSLTPSPGRGRRPQLFAQIQFSSNFALCYTKTRLDQSEARKSLKGFPSHGWAGSGSPSQVWIQPLIINITPSAAAAPAAPRCQMLL